jgi:hypothetical protein
MKIEFSTKNILICGLIIIAMLSIISAVYGYKNPKVTVQKEFMNLPVPWYGQRIKKEFITVEKVKVLNKEDTADKIEGIPKDIINNPNKHITAIGVVEPYEGPTEVLATFDGESGETDLRFKRKPRKLFGFPNDKKLGIRIGKTSDNTEDIDYNIYGEWSPLRVGNIYFNVYGEASKMQIKGMIGLSYQW